MGKRRGCFECSRRRIICDMTEPQCHKCIKKGINCSGIGTRYRFCPGIASRGKLKNRRVPVLNIDENVFSKRETTLSRRNSNQVVESSAAIYDFPHRLPNIEIMKNDRSRRNMAHSTQRDLAVMQLVPEIQLLDAQTRLLFSHFSIAVAPALIPLEDRINGYRDILLPMALQNPKVKEAICMVAALHLGAKVPKFRVTANKTRLTIIFGLKRLIHDRSWREVLSVTNWAVIILLLAGEMIRGGPDYSYLLRMLISLVRAREFHDERTEAHSFLMEQTKIVELFGGPFLGETEGVQALSTGIQFYRDVVPQISYDDTNSPRKLNVLTLVAAVLQATNIYLNRALYCSPFTPPLVEQAYPQPVFPIPSKSSNLEHLKDLVLGIGADTPGAHTLVWVYFIGAAESNTPEDREFFSHRLKGLYEVIGFENINVGLRYLMHWWEAEKKQHESLNGERWTERLAEIESLVM